METVLAMVLPALLPAVTDGLRGVAQKWFGGSKPIGVDDQVKLMQAEVIKLQALAQLDTPSANISQWVADLRASFRYIAAACIIGGTILLVLLYFAANYASPEQAPVLKANLEPIVDLFAQMAASVFAFLFGDRMYLSLRKAK